MGTQLVLSFAKRYFFNLSNALNSKHNSQTIRILAPYRNISLFSLVFILGVVLLFCSCNSRKIPLECTTVIGQLLFSNSEIQFGEVGVGKIGFGTLKIWVRKTVYR